MSNASLPITQSHVEQLAKTYLETCGCSVRERYDEFVVSVPETASTDLLDTGSTTLVCSADPERIGDKPALHPESKTFQGLLQEAAKRAPVGRVELTGVDTEIRLPAWLVESTVSVASTQFMPYYDRTAIIGLFRIEMETVSEYQTQLLRASAVDTSSMEPLPELTDRLLTHSTPDSSPIEATSVTADEHTATKAIDTLSDHVVKRVQPTIEETQEGATRAAGAELEEYRQLQDQRIEELEAEITRVTQRIKDLSTEVEKTESQADRLETLQDRKDLKTERDELQGDLEGILEARSAGFPEKRREIGDRHSLTVTVKPLTLTEYQYEQGELEMTLVDSTTRTSVRIGYGDGVGVTETITCEHCGTTLTGDNPLRLDGGKICCASCRG